LLYLFWQFALKGFLLFLLCFVVTRARDVQRKTCSLEVVPPALRVDLPSGLLAHPVSHFGASPQSVVWSAKFKGVLQFPLLFPREKR